MNQHHIFNQVTLLVTHYNRSKSLERLLESFEIQRISFGGIVVSDDCSNEMHQSYINDVLLPKFRFRFITAPVNGGLGQNINKGQDAVTTPYTLYVQEDFVALEGCGDHLENGLKAMEERADLDTVRFYSYLDYPRLAPYRYGFSEMVFKFWDKGLDKFPYYSDHPHLRRTTFLEKFGRYTEGKNPENTEFDMMIAFLQRKGKGLLFTAYKNVFDQVNTSSEPSTMKRKFWRYSNNFFIVSAVTTYRYLKFYANYLFK